MGDGVNVAGGVEMDLEKEMVMVVGGGEEV